MAHSPADSVANKPGSTSIAQSSMPMTRRDLIVSAGAVAGGLLVGCDVMPLAPDSEISAATPRKWAPVSAWISVASDNLVTIYCAQSEMGQGVLTALPMLVAEELEVDWQNVRAEMPASLPVYSTKRGGRRFTGNSDSVMSSFKPMRLAGATAREMLIAEAAGRWNVPVDECSARQGMVTHDNSGRRATYGELAEGAAQQPVPENVALKDPADWTAIGQPLPRTDVPDKAYGRTTFGIDVNFDGLLTATIRACPTLGGTLASVDPAPALTMPGVKNVIELDNAVAVVAQTYWQARKAIDALEPEWNLDEATPVNQAEFDANLEAGLTAKGIPGKVTGEDADALLANAGKIVEAEYRAPLLSHLCLEPMNATALVRDGKVELWAPTQAQTSSVEEVAKALGIPKTDVLINTTFMGGGFGRRNNTDFCVQSALIANELPGVPVKLIWSREEDVKHDFYRPATFARYRGSLKDDGSIEAFTAQFSGASLTDEFKLPANLDPMLNVMAGSGDLYQIKNKSLTYARVDSAVPNGIWRSTTLSQNGFFAESFVDELAHAAGKSPLEFREAMLKKPEKTGPILKALAQQADLNTPRPSGTGVGMALINGWNSTCALAVEVTIDNSNNIKINKIYTVLDGGLLINPAIVKAQVQGAVYFGLSATLWGEISYKNGEVQQSNFDSQPVLRYNQAPDIEVRLVESTAAPGGVGEIATAAIAPALTNAIFAATGERIRTLPLSGSGFRLTA